MSIGLVVLRTVMPSSFFSLDEYFFD